MELLISLINFVYDVAYFVATRSEKQIKPLDYVINEVNYLDVRLFSTVLLRINRQAEKGKWLASDGLG